MATAYKYVEREAENQINWAEVGSNFSNMLNEEARVREEKKAAIDDATREYQKVVANVPVGENYELNKAALAFADDLQQADSSGTFLSCEVLRAGTRSASKLFIVLK